jgi:aminoglycoside/choline kinase family phosphotransferase
MDALEDLFQQHFHVPAERADPIRGLGASERQIVRLSNEQSRAIGVLHDVREENAAFIAFSRHFAAHRLRVPEIYAVDLSRNAYLEEDLGDTTLYQFLAANRKGGAIASRVVDMYRKVVAILPRFQVEAGRDLDYSLCYPRDSYDGRSIAWDLNYFKYFFLMCGGIAFGEQTLEDDFERLVEFLLQADRRYFLYRDFQSRNVMVCDGEPCFLDYQGGRRGALQYDIASLLYDAKADLPPSLRQELLGRYLDALSGHVRLDRDAFMRHYYAYVLVRIMQAMGAYGFRGFFERKPLFLQSVPYALGNLRWLLDNVEIPVKLPALLGAFRSMLASDRLQRLEAPGNPITVRVFSFSFRLDSPRDDTGHGGGFVFDARNLPNPGREARYRNLTGRDASVADYLSRAAGVREFLSGAATMVDASIRDYQRRGFADLMVSFGCTGGQHRSVYLAERLAEHLAGRPGVEVVLRHVGLERMDR